MRLIRRLLAGLYVGSAFRKFIDTKYEDAARLFEKALRLDPNSDRMELTYSCLGRCYLHLGRMDEALKNLSLAYDLYQKNMSTVFQSEFELTQYKDFLNAYSCALEKVGQIDFAREVAQQANRCRGHS